MSSRDPPPRLSGYVRSAGQVQALLMSAPLAILSLTTLISAAIEETSVDVGLLHRSGASQYPPTVPGHSVLDPGPNYIRIQDLCESGFVFRMLIQTERET